MIEAGWQQFNDSLLKESGMKRHEFDSAVALVDLNLQEEIPAFMSMTKDQQQDLIRYFFRKEFVDVGPRCIS